MTITVINQLTARDVAVELQEQPDFAADVLDEIGRAYDAAELSDWARGIATALSDDAKCVVVALAATMGDDA